MHCTESDEDAKEYEPFLWELPPRILGSPEVLLLNNGRSVIFHPSTSLGCVAVRGSNALCTNLIHCFEVEFYPPYFGESRSVGVGTRQAILHHKKRRDRSVYSNPYDSLVGLDEHSWGLNYDGNLVHRKVKTLLRDKLSADSEPLQIKVTFDGYSGVLLYHVNGESLGLAFEQIDQPVYPMVSSSSRNTRMNFLWKKSSIGNLQTMCRGVIRKNVRKDNINILPLPSHVIAFLRFNN